MPKPKNLNPAREGHKEVLARLHRALNALQAPPIAGGDGDDDEGTDQDTDDDDDGDGGEEAS